MPTLDPPQGSTLRTIECRHDCSLVGISSHFRIGSLDRATLSVSSTVTQNRGVGFNHLFVSQERMIPWPLLSRLASDRRCTMGVVIMFPTTCYNQLFKTTLSNQIRWYRYNIGYVGDSFYTLWCEDEQLTGRDEYLGQSARKRVSQKNWLLRRYIKNTAWDKQHVCMYIS